LSTVLESHGLIIEIPEGWDGRIYRRPESLAICQVANFAIALDADDFGGTTAGVLPSGGVFATLFENDPAFANSGMYEPRGLPLPLDSERLTSSALVQGLPGQAGLQHFFSENDRAFMLHVIVSVTTVYRGLIDSLSATLATLKVGAGPEPPDAPGDRLPLDTERVALVTTGAIPTGRVLRLGTEFGLRT
jgi:hypothetical protein